MSSSAFIVTFADTYENVSREHVVAVFTDEKEADRFCVAAQKEADRVIEARRKRYSRWQPGDPLPKNPRPTFDIGLWDDLTESIYYQVEEVTLNPTFP